MDQVVGRSDDMLIFRGVNVFPSQIESVLLQVGEIEPHYQLVVNRGSKHIDELEVLVEVPAHIYADAHVWAYRKALDLRSAKRSRNNLHRKSDRSGNDSAQRGQSATRDRQANVAKLTMNIIRRSGRA